MILITLRRIDALRVSSVVWSDSLIILIREALDCPLSREPYSSPISLNSIVRDLRRFHLALSIDFNTYVQLILINKCIDSDNECVKEKEEKAALTQRPMSNFKWSLPFHTTYFHYAFATHFFFHLVLNRHKNSEAV